MLADRKGNLAATVTTGGLYKWFAEPDMSGLSKQKDMKTGEVTQVKTWREALGDLRELQERVNAKSRWLSRTGGDIDQALVQATGRLAETRLGFQAKLVAATDLMANGDDRGGNLAVLQADLRITEREIHQLKNDVRALTALTREESKMSIADKIERGVAARRRTEARSAEEIAQRQRYADQAGDRRPRPPGGTRRRGGRTGSARGRPAPRPRWGNRPGHRRDAEGADRGRSAASPRGTRRGPGLGR